MSSTEESFVKDVVEFNKTILCIPKRSLYYLNQEEYEHLVKSLKEETEEFIQAQSENIGYVRIVQSVDALIDLMYFAVGGLYKMGLTVEEIVACQKVVHQANMTKKKGVVERRNTGAADAVKPADWVSPEERIMETLWESVKN